MAAPAPPEVVDAALLAVADGATQETAGRIAGVSQHTVSRWVNRLKDRLDGLTTRLRYRATRKVLRGLDGMLDAQMAAASDPQLRHGPQAMRVCLEAASAIGGVRDVTFNGDVNVDQSTVSVDARSVNVIASSPPDLAGELARIRGTLGIG